MIGSALEGIFRKVGHLPGVLPNAATLGESAPDR